MFIKYNRANNHVLSTYRADETHVLRPGWNEFPKHIWEIHSNDAEIKRLMSEGHIEISDVKVVQQEGRKKTTVDLGKTDVEVHLTQIKDEKKAIEIVKGTFNREILQRWLDEETRSKVKRVIEKQIDPLLNPKSESD